MEPLLVEIADLVGGHSFEEIPIGLLAIPGLVRIQVQGVEQHLRVIKRFRLLRLNWLVSSKFYLEVFENTVLAVLLLL